MNGLSPIENKLVWPVLDVATPFGRRLHKGLTEEVRAKHNLAVQAGTYNVRLYSKKFTDPVTQMEGRIRRWFLRRTAAWDGPSVDEGIDKADRNVLPDDSTQSAVAASTGMRVMPARNLMEVQKERAALQVVWDALVGQVVSRWDEVIFDARDNLHRDTFNPKWYPGSASQFKAGFRFGWDVLELPGRGHWMLDLPNEVLAEMSAKSEARSQACLRGMKVEIMGRLLKPLTEFAMKLDGGDDFLATRWERLEKLSAEVERLNVDSDPAIAGLIEDLRRCIAVDPQACKDSGEVRAATAAKASAIADRMSELFG